MAYVDQNTYDTIVPVSTAAAVPANDFFAPNSDLSTQVSNQLKWKAGLARLFEGTHPEKGSLGVYRPNRRPNTLAEVSQYARIAIDSTAISRGRNVSTISAPTR